MSNPLTQLLQRTLHGVADVRRVVKAQEAGEVAHIRPRSSARGGLAGAKGAKGAKKCTPCAAAAYVQKDLRKAVQQYQGGR